MLVVFDDYLDEGNFLGVARREMERAGVDVPLWVSYRELLEGVGPLGLAWRSPDVLEPSCAFTVPPQQKPGGWRTPDRYLAGNGWRRQLNPSHPAGNIAPEVRRKSTSNID